MVRHTTKTRSAAQSILSIDAPPSSSFTAPPSKARETALGAEDSPHSPAKLVPPCSSTSYFSTSPNPYGKGKENIPPLPDALALLDPTTLSMATRSNPARPTIRRSRTTSTVTSSSASNVAGCAADLKSDLEESQPSDDARMEAPAPKKRRCTRLSASSRSKSSTDNSSSGGSGLKPPPRIGRRPRQLSVSSSISFRSENASGPASTSSSPSDSVFSPLFQPISDIVASPNNPMTPPTSASKTSKRAANSNSNRSGQPPFSVSRSSSSLNGDRRSAQSHRQERFASGVDGDFDDIPPLIQAMQAQRELDCNPLDASSKLGHDSILGHSSPPSFALDLDSDSYPATPSHSPECRAFTSMSSAHLESPTESPFKRSSKQDIGATLRAASLQSMDSADKAARVGVFGMAAKLKGYPLLRYAFKSSAAGQVRDGPQCEENSDCLEQVIGREEEKKALWDYLLNSGTSIETNELQNRQVASLPQRSLYVSGPPGTGKTALVTQVAADLKRTQLGWRTAFVNCMGKDKGGVWRRIAQAWGFVSQKELDQALGSEVRGSKYLLILDEIDALIGLSSSDGSSDHQQSLKALLTLPFTYPNAVVKVVAISNSLDLTSRRAISSALGEHMPTSLIFKAYTARDFVRIIKGRAAAVAAGQVDDKAVELVGRKVEAMSGDLRLCLSVMEGAVRIAEIECESAMAGATDTIPPLVKITISHALKAWAKLGARLAPFDSKSLPIAAQPGSKGGSSTWEHKIRSLHLQVRLALLALLIAKQRQNLALGPVYAAASRSLLANLTIESLYLTYAHLLEHPLSPLPPVSQSDFDDLLMQAEVVGVISLGHRSERQTQLRHGGTARAKRGKGRSTTVTLNPSEDGIKHALGITVGTGSVVGDEIRLIWVRENEKCLKAVERVAA